MNYLADTRRWRQRGSARQQGSSEEALDMKSWIFSFQKTPLNLSGALHSSCVSSLAALVPQSVTRWSGVWSPGVHREARSGSLLFQKQCSWPFERRQVSTNGPQECCLCFVTITAPVALLLAPYGYGSSSFCLWKIFMEVSLRWSLNASTHQSKTS